MAERVAELGEKPYLGKPLKGVSIRIGPEARLTPRSLRVGDYRVIYLVDPLTRTVILVTVRHRRHVYREI